MALPGIEYTVTVKGTAYRFVRCEHCRAEFAYLLEREGIESATSFLGLENSQAQERATEGAAKSLQGQLADAVDPVPCPECGWYQANMIRVIRRLHQRWLAFVGAGFLLLAFLAGLCYLGARLSERAEDIAHSRLYGWIAVASASIGLLFMLIRQCLAWRLRPNDGDSTQRIAEGRARAVTETELAALKLARRLSEGDASVPATS